MKKLFVLASVAFMSLTLSAQHVTPVNIAMVEMRLDTLRDFYAADKAAYMVQLQHIELNVKGNEEALKLAQKQLSDEKSYAKCIESYIKDTEKVLKNMEKDCNNEKKDVTDLQNTIDKQTSAVNKLTMVTHESKPKFLAQMASERENLYIEQKHIQARLATVNRQQEQIRMLKEGLQVFNVEITNKENDIKLKKGQHKNTSSALKTEMKNVKAELKATKK